MISIMALVAAMVRRLPGRAVFRHADHLQEAVALGIGKGELPVHPAVRRRPRAQVGPPKMGRMGIGEIAQDGVRFPQGKSPS
jgi:hypothetical protein